MKNKLLLTLLPALLVLSACNPFSSYAAAGTKVNQFVEDTAAHEELFGGADQGDYFGKLQTPFYSVRDDEDFPMAYQINYDSVNDKLAIRFIAAVKNLNVTASWKRGVAGADGEELRDKSFSDPAQPATKYYKALTDGKDVLEVGKPGDFEDYSGFVVYTIHNIPYSDNKNAYVAAYLTLVSEEDGEDIAQSDVLAVKIEIDDLDDPYDSANAFIFSSTATHHFLQGTLEGNEETLLTATEYDSGDNVATYRELNLLTTDSFGSFYYSPTIFQYFGYNDFAKDTAGIYFEESGLSGYNKPKFNGAYSIVVSRTEFNKLKATTTKTVSVEFATNYGTNYGDSIFIAVSNDGWNANTKYVLDWHDGNNWSKTLTLTIGSYVKYVVGPSSGGTPSRWESGSVHYITHTTTSISCQGWE